METDLDICNSALAKLGVDPIDSLSETSKAAVTCNELLVTIRQDLLRKHKWNFATRRDVLTPETDTFVDGDVTVGTDKITETAHGRRTGDKVKLSTTGVVPTGLTADETYYLIVTSSNDYQIALTLADSRAGTAIDITAAAGGGTHTLTFLPAWGDGSKFKLPSDSLKLVQVGENSEIDRKVEEGYIISNATEIPIKYVYDVTDVTLYDANFVEHFVWTLAEQLAFPLFQSASLAVAISNKAKVAMDAARSYDGAEDTPDDILGTNGWDQARHRGSRFNDNW